MIFFPFKRIDIRIIRLELWLKKSFWHSLSTRINSTRFIIESRLLLRFILLLMCFTEIGFLIPLVFSKSRNEVYWYCMHIKKWSLMILYAHKLNEKIFTFCNILKLLKIKGFKIGIAYLFLFSNYIQIRIWIFKQIFDILNLPV